jgi:GTP-binding protein
MSDDATDSPASETDDEERRKALEWGRWLFTQDCTFQFGAADLKQLPDAGHPEVAFAGRSNVGKSSLVNALTGRKTLARTSHTPGRTQQLNFFLLGEKLYLVDLPGYGYAKVSKTQVKAWTKTVKSYLRGRPNLRRVCLLIDGRHGIKPVDRELMDMLDEAAVSFQVVLTKCDKVKPSELQQRLAATGAELKTHTAAYPDIAVTSAHKATGIEELRAEIAALAPRS